MVDSPPFSFLCGVCVFLVYFFMNVVIEPQPVFCFVFVFVFPPPPSTP